MRANRRVPGWLHVVIAAFAFSAGAAAAPKAGEVPPPYIGKTLDGKPVMVADFSGKAIIVSYWATWCTYCLKEMDTLNNIQKAASDRVQVVTVNIETERVFRKVAKALSPFEFLVLHDPDRKAQNAYRVKALPYMVIIGKDGRIDTVKIGYGEKELDNIVNSINRAIGAIPST